MIKLVIYPLIFLFDSIVIINYVLENKHQVGGMSHGSEIRLGHLHLPVLLNLIIYILNK